MAIEITSIDFVPQPIIPPADVINNPEDGWVERLRQGNKVWLVKESEYAYIEWAWEDSCNASISDSWGRIGLKKAQKYATSCESWMMCSNGCGSDQKRLLLPIRGNLEANPTPLEMAEIRKLRREVSILRKKVEYLYLMR